MVAGNTADLAFSLQTAQGTGAAASQHRIYLTGGGVGGMRDVNDIEETSSGRLRNTAFVGQVRAEGGPQAAVRPNSIGLLLYAALGTKSVTGAADPWTHTFTLASTQPWLTMWRMLGSLLFEKFVDCKVGSLNFQSEAGGLLQVTAGVLGLQSSYLTAAEATAAAETTDAFVHADGAGGLVLEGVVSSQIESFGCDINLGHNLQQGDSIGGYAITEGMIGVTVTTRQSITDFALWNRFHYGSATPSNLATPTRTILELGAPGLAFKFTRPGTPERSLQFTATRLQVVSIAGIEPNTTGDPIKATVTYRVYQPAGGVSGITAILKNGQATYPTAA